jgi:hypothetical protein
MLELYYRRRFDRVHERVGGRGADPQNVTAQYFVSRYSSIPS